MWSNKWEYCQNCGESDPDIRPHYARGVCRRCYLRLPDQALMLKRRNSKDSYKEMRKGIHKRWRENHALQYAEYQLQFWTQRVERLRAI